MDPMTDIWLSESQCARAGMANLESEANLEVCACERKNEERGGKKHKSALKWLDLSDTVVHGVPSWWKPKKKDGYSSECNEKAANSELRNNSKPFLFHLFGTIRQMWNPQRWRQHQSLAEAFTGIDLLEVTPSHTDWVGEAKIQGGCSAAALASSPLLTNGERRGFLGAPGQGEF